MHKKHEFIFWQVFLATAVVLALFSLRWHDRMLLSLLVVCASMVVSSVIAAVAMKSYSRSQHTAYAFLGPTFIIIASIAFCELLVYFEWITGGPMGSDLYIRLVAMQRLLTALTFLGLPLMDSPTPFRKWLFRSIGMTAVAALILFYPGLIMADHTLFVTAPLMHVTGGASALIYAAGLIRVMGAREKTESGIFQGLLVVCGSGVLASLLLVLEGRSPLVDVIGHGMYVLGYGLTYALVLRRTNQLEFAALQRALAESSAGQKRLMARLITLREDERRLFSHELHDDVGQSLMLMIGMLDPTRLSPDDALRKCTDARRLAVGTLETVRRMARQNRPPVLDDIGLVAALQTYVAEFTAAHAIAGELRVFGPDDRRFSPGIETAVYRAVVEALTNVAKHSGCSRFSVVLDVHGNGLTAVVEDDGRGFDVSSTSEGLGLATMAERLEVVGGTCAIESAPGKGTTVVLRLPLRGDGDGPKSIDSR